MKSIEVYEEGETVMIRARISKVIFDKDKILYEVEDLGGKKYLNKFLAKDIVACEKEEKE